MGIVSERDGKVYFMVTSPTFTTRLFSYSLSQIRSITSLQPRHNGVHMYNYAHTAHYSYAIIMQFSCPLTPSRYLRAGSGNARLVAKLLPRIIFRDHGKRTEFTELAFRDVLIRAHRTVDVQKKSPFYPYNGRPLKKTGGERVLNGR